MPPPTARPTILSASRASIVDEKKRQERVGAKEKGTMSSPKMSKVFGTHVFRLEANRDCNALQKEKGDKKEDKKTSGKEGRRFDETYRRPMIDNYNPGKYLDYTDQLGGATGTSTNRGIPSSTHKGGSTTHGKNVTSTSGQSRGATGSNSGGVFPSCEIQTSIGGTFNPYEYTRISASQAKLYHDNLDFYMNKIPSKPVPGQRVEEMLKWKGDYGMLERNHRYIQWLFPIPEGNGLNMYAQQLFEHEAQAIRDDKTTSKRVLMAYKMMLDFYGMQLVSSLHGTVKRSSRGWKERYDHLNRSRHNLLRITRILKSLGELGYERLQAPWVNFLIEEAVIKKELPNLNGQCLIHWIMAVKDDGEREMLYRRANGLPISQDNVDMDGMNSESEDDDNERETQIKTLEQNDAEMPRKPSENSDNRQTTKESEMLHHVDECTAMFKQTKVSESLNTASVSKQNAKTHEDKQIENIANETLARTMDKPIKNAEYVESVEQKYEKHNETPVNDRIDRTSTEGLKLSNTEVKASWKKQRAEADLPSDNLKFYQNVLLSRPAPGYTVETLLKYKGDYDFFDEYWCFIHWLFPIPESTGMNLDAQPLLEHEAKEIRSDDKLSSRVLEAFKLMLNFYGMCLCDDLVGQFKRNKKTYKDRYDYLQRYRDNYMRITRILISIGQLGYERFQVPWIDFLITEGIDNGKFPTLDGQCITHWISAIKDDVERQAMFQKYRQLARFRAVIVVEKEDMDVDDDYDVDQSIRPILPHSSLADFGSAEGGGFFQPLSDV